MKYLWECPECQKGLRLDEQAIRICGAFKCPACHTKAFVPLDVLKELQIASTKIARTRRDRYAEKMLKAITRLERHGRNAILADLPVECLREAREAIEGGNTKMALSIIDAEGPDTDEKKFQASMRKRGVVEYLQLKDQLAHIEGELGRLNYRIGKGS